MEWNYSSLSKLQRSLSKLQRCRGCNYLSMLGLKWIHHDSVIKWKCFPRYWPFVRGIHRLPVNSPHKGQWRGALMLPLICVWINGWVNNREAGDLRPHRAHYDVILMVSKMSSWWYQSITRTKVTRHQWDPMALVWGNFALSTQSIDH